jgi:hypothetical protein
MTDFVSTQGDIPANSNSVPYTLDLVAINRLPDRAQEI